MKTLWFGKSLESRSRLRDPSGIVVLAVLACIAVSCSVTRPPQDAATEARVPSDENRALAPPTSPRKPSTASLSGVVVDEQGKPLAGTTIVVESAVLLGGTRSTTADGKGRFRFPVLPIGSYTLQCELFGYFDLDLTFPLGEDDRACEVHLQLEENPAEKIGIEVRAHETIVFHERT